MRMRSIYIFFVLPILLSFPLLAFAALIPCGGENRPCTLSCFFVLVDNIINFLLFNIAIPLTATALMVAGIHFVAGGSEQAITKGRAIFKFTMIGIFLAFGAWLIIDLILGNLLQSGYLPWNEFPTWSCGKTTPTPTTPTTPTAPLTPTAPSGTYTGQQARDFLSQRGIGVKTNCPIGQQTGCVGLEGIKQSTLNEVASLANQVGASNVYVTAGTEGCGTIHASGKRSHCTGDKIDLRTNPALDNYIQTKYTYIGQRSDRAAQYKAPDGTIYAKEEGAQPHWDVLVSI